MRRLRRLHGWFGPTPAGRQRSMLVMWAFVVVVIAACGDGPDTPAASTTVTPSAGPQATTTAPTTPFGGTTNSTGTPATPMPDLLVRYLTQLVFLNSALTDEQLRVQSLASTALESPAAIDVQLRGAGDAFAESASAHAAVSGWGLNPPSCALSFHQELLTAAASYDETIAQLASALLAADTAGVDGRFAVYTDSLTALNNLLDSGPVDCPRVAGELLPGSVPTPTQEVTRTEAAPADVPYVVAGRREFDWRVWQDDCNLIPAGIAKSSYTFEEIGPGDGRILDREQIHIYGHNAGGTTSDVGVRTLSYPTFEFSWDASPVHSVRTVVTFTSADSVYALQQEVVSIDTATCTVVLVTANYPG